jgi:hypothetical protein
VGTKTFDGVWFQSYSRDHAPPHVHASYGEVLVIVDLMTGGGVRQSLRWNAVVPKNGKRSDVRYVLAVAAEHWHELWALWEKTHGTPSE